MTVIIIQLVKNKPMYAITYTPPKGVQAKDRLIVAEKLSQYIDIFHPDEEERKNQIGRITTRDKKEYWYLLNEKAAQDKLTDKEAVELKPEVQYKEILERITEEEFDNLSEKDIEILLIKKELDRAYALSPQIVKNENVTTEEYAMVAENIAELPGINATTDWVREYPYGDTFKRMVGNITTEKEGVPAENIDYYLAKGYSRNDRVGENGLELQYEELLRGRKEQVSYTMDSNFVILESEVVVPGESGKDLILTVDMEFQEMVDEILREELREATAGGRNKLLRDALAVVIDPHTGELLAVSGQSFVDENQDKIYDSAFKTIYDQNNPGSIVKGATVLAGYHSGIISPGNRVYDEPIHIKGTPIKGSWTDLGWVNDLDALRRSSNVYMFYIAMKMGGEYNYYPGKKISFNPQAFQEMRNYFKQFGLGTKTGVDFPNESPGLTGALQDGGLLMDFAIGQYDTYTVMQLAQYISTIANGGNRVQPHFLKEVRNPSMGEDLGTVYRSINTKILNKIVMDETYIQRVQEGFRQVFQEPGGTAFNYFRGNEYKIAGKTGTAESDHGTINLTMVSYAPYDNPEIAVSVVIPRLDEDMTSNNHQITSKIFDAYFTLKKERANNVPNE
ncbi:penicillin-binding transpeptidase domain-containing protein [Ornithinibacillus scapharcae]|uniref:penicillin-binding transpeptidase domain-containing protein n=1 Tax=Ornithinibacillus scapharcae TaxID=1147159 RepID=UPI000225B387